MRIFRISVFIGAALFLPAVWAAAQTEKPPAKLHAHEAEIALVNTAQRPLEAGLIGTNLTVSAQGLSAGKLYDVFLRDAKGLYVSMMRQVADTSGNLMPAILWYQSGVVGCAKGAEEHLKLPYRFRTFEEAEAKLAATSFVLELRDRERVIARKEFRFAVNKNPLVYPADANGCLLNSTDGSEDIYIAGRNFPTGTILEVSLAAHQGVWRPGDRFRDVRSRREPQRVRFEEGKTSVVAPLWNHAELRVGAYDVIARPFQSGSDRPATNFLQPMDVIGWNGDVGIVVFDASHTHLVEQIAGEIIHEYPWFKYVDGFMLGTDVWGALDPKRKPIGHPGTYAAWYVVDHQNTWTDGDPLTDVTGGYKITPIKPGCINYTWTLLWPNPNPPNVNDANPTRPYDVVIDFGNLAATLGQFMSDGVYTEGIDFVDYRGAVGFYLVRDPRLGGSFQTNDVEIPAMGDACDTVLNTTINWTDPPFYGNQSFMVALGIDDEGGVNAAGRCPMDPGKVEMRAHVYYPKDPMSTNVAAGGPFPVVVFYHGQQAWAIPGYLGYEYLGTLLASHGFIVYSIDARSMLDATIASRGEHLRAHLRKLVGLNAMGSGSIFSQQMDLQNVALVGHSRGGEAVVAAWEWQRVQPDAGYTMKAIVSIAPVQFFGEPNWAPPEPTFQEHVRDIPYMIIHGSDDGDVADFQGLRIYDRAADIRQIGQTPKGMVFVEHANHNYFNSVWEAQEGSDYGGGGLLAATDQRDTAKVYIHSFLEAYLKGRNEYLNFFSNVIPDPGVATVATDFQAPASDYILVDSNEVLPLGIHDKTTNSAGGAITVSNINDYEERLLAVTEPAPWSSYHGETWAASLSWTGLNSGYTTAITPGVLAALNPTVQTQLSFRVGQVFRTMGSPNPPNVNQDFGVRLWDSDGHASPWVFVRDFAPIYPPWDTSSWGGTKTVMGVVRIPLQIFTVNTSSQLELNKLSLIEFDFRATAAGEIVFDDIRLTK